jgi:hypothetical protein
MVNDAKVLSPHPEQGGAIYFRLASDKVRLLRMQLVPVFVLPSFLGVIAVAKKDRGSIPIEFLLRKKRTAFDN